MIIKIDDDCLELLKNWATNAISDIDGVLDFQTNDGNKIDLGHGPHFVLKKYRRKIKNLLNQLKCSIPEDILDHNVSNYLPNRIVNVLKEHKINTVGALTALTEQQFFTLEGLGKKSMTMTKDFMHQYNLRFAVEKNG